MTTTIPCVECRDVEIAVERIVCARCLAAHPDPDAHVRRLRHDLQQYRVVVSQRFSDTKAFLNRMRAAAHVSGMEPVEGPTAVRIVGQRATTYPGTWLTAYRMVEENLAGVGFGTRTDVRSVSVTLVDGGYDMTVVEVRRLLEGELAGVAGVCR